MKGTIDQQGSDQENDKPVGHIDNTNNTTIRVEEGVKSVGDKTKPVKSKNNTKDNSGATKICTSSPVAMAENASGDLNSSFHMNRENGTMGKDTTGKSFKANEHSSPTGSTLKTDFEGGVVTPGGSAVSDKGASMDHDNGDGVSNTGQAGDRTGTNGNPSVGNGAGNKSNGRGDGKTTDGTGGNADGVNGSKEQKGSGAGAGAGSSSGGNPPNGTSTDKPAAPPPPPVLRGTLSYNVEMRRHVIRGMWNYENSKAFPPQRFELVRTLGEDEELRVLPKDGEFHGSFSLAYFHTTSKGKQKERSKVISESGVKIKFTKIEGQEGHFNVDGQGTNQFGIFNINGTAKPSKHEGDDTYQVELRKRYAPSPQASEGAAATPASATDASSKKNKKNKKRKHSQVGGASVGEGNGGAPGPLPPPSESYPSHVICLRGSLRRDQSDDLGATEVVHRINGMWSSGLDLILADPENKGGLCNKFEYEHKSTLPNNAFPVSGRYSGWFNLTNNDNSRTRVSEKDITLKFRKNNAGYYNVEGRGSNAFGRYTISGTLTNDHIITIFRHFQQRKPKTKDSQKPASAGPAPSSTPTAVSAGAATGKADQGPPVAMKLKLEDVDTPETEGDLLPAIEQPAHGTYSAVSRGIFRLNDDGAHICTGHWALTREHFDNGVKSTCTFRLEPHFAAEGATAMKKAAGEETADPKTIKSSTDVSLSAAPPGSMTFPIDSAMYKGSFNMKRTATAKASPVIDQQVVLKYRKNKRGTYNVYGKGINEIGMFKLIGTLILSSKRSGHVELYRTYPAPVAAATTPKQSNNKVTGGGAAKASVSKAAGGSGGKGYQDKGKATGVVPPGVVSSSSSSSTTPAAGAADAATTPSSTVARPPLMRRESTRVVKLPTRLEDDDPDAQTARLVEKCGAVLKTMREKDAATGQFFGIPVDPVAHRVPTYHEVISEPMDLGTIQTRFDKGEIKTTEDFGRLVRLVFENAMTFNVEPNHVVHQAARQLLILFNQKFRDIERQADNIRRNHKLPEEGKKTKKQKVKEEKEKEKEKKRKATTAAVPEEKPKSQKRARLDEAQAMATKQAQSVAALMAAVPPGSLSSGPVSRGEFNMLVQMIQQLQAQMVQTHTLLANLCPDTVTDVPKKSSKKPSSSSASTSASSAPAPTPAPKPVPAPKPAPKRQKPVKKEPTAEEKAIAAENTPLTLQEQEVLTETINALPGEKLSGVIQIIRESAQLGADEEEIDLEIDQLDTATQRKLQRYVNKVRIIERGPHSVFVWSMKEAVQAPLLVFFFAQMAQTATVVWVQSGFAFVPFPSLFLYSLL